MRVLCGYYSFYECQSTDTGRRPKKAPRLPFSRVPDPLGLLDIEGGFVL